MKPHKIIFAKEVSQCESFIIGTGTEVGDGVPTEIDLMIEGEYKGYVSPFDKEKKQRTWKVTAAHIDGAYAYCKQIKADTPHRDFVIDYEHATWKDIEAPAAGWIKDVLVVARGGKKVMRGIVEWTKKAEEYLRNREYRYFSPVFATNAFDKKSGKLLPCIFFDGALVNEPHIDELLPIVASQNNQSIIFGKESYMDELLNWLRNFLGLPLAATAEEILAELGKLQDKIKAGINAGTVTAKAVLDFLDENKPILVTAKQSIQFQSEVMAKLGLDTKATPEQALAMVVAAKDSVAQLSMLQSKVTLLEDARFGEKFNLVLAKGIDTGRIQPAQKENKDWLQTQTDWAKRDFPSFETYLCKTGPVIAPVGELRINDAAPDADKENTLVIAKAAQDYIATEKTAGRTVTTTDAVNHILKSKGISK